MGRDRRAVPVVGDDSRDATEQNVSLPRLLVPLVEVFGALYR